MYTILCCTSLKGISSGGHYLMRGNLGHRDCWAHKVCRKAEEYYCVFIILKMITLKWTMNKYLHTVHSMHCKWLANCQQQQQMHSSFSFVFWLKCHHQGANIYVTKTYSNKIVLQCLCISNVQIIVKIYSV